MRHWCHPLASGFNKLETLWVHMGTMTENKSWEETVLAEIRVRVCISWSKSLGLGLIGTPELGTMR